MPPRRYVQNGRIVGGKEAMRACLGCQYDRDKDEFKCIAKMFPHLCTNPCAYRPLFAAIVLGAFTECELKQMVKVSQTKDITFEIVDGDIPEGTNGIRELVAEFEAEESISPTYSSFRKCQFPGCHLDISHRSPSAKFCAGHSEFTHNERVKDANRRYYQKNKDRINKQRREDYKKKK